MEVLSLLRLVVGSLFLGYASYSDMRTRRVGNGLWIILGSVAFIILFVDLLMREGTVWVHYLIFIPAGILFFEVYVERKPIIDEEGIHFVPLAFLSYCIVVIVLATQAFLLYPNPSHMNLFYHLLTIPAMIVISHLLYQSRLLKGGADAKAVMCLAVLVPFYPDFYGFPLVRMSERTTDLISILFPFSLVIVMNSVILVIFVPLVFLAINARRRDLEFPQCLFGFKVSLNNFPRFTWLMERVEQGELRTVLFPRRGEDQRKEMQELIEMGRDRAWATPQLPFMIPLCIGFIISFLIGNLVMWFLVAITG